MNPEELFEKLIKNEISREEFERLLEGLDDEDILARYEIYLQNQFEKEIDKHFSENESEKKEVKGNLKVTKKITPKKKDTIKKKRGRDYPLAAVIVLFVGILFSALFIISQNNASSEEVVVAKTTIDHEIISKTTPNGRKFRMTLDDGSFVHMNSASSIVYPNKFDAESRDIEIEGEVYFDIARDETRPFKIKVKDYYVEVLGTSFNIQAHEDEAEFAVSVESGSVKVKLNEDGSNTIILEKDQKLIFNPETNVTEIMDVVAKDALSWREGILKFDSTPMSKVEKIVQRWYGVNLIIEGESIRQKSISGTHKNKNIKSVIEALTFATNTSYSVKNNSIIIKN